MTASGMPGAAMTAMSAAEARSQTIITRRRGQRSARPASSGPPTSGPRSVTTPPVAAQNAEPVAA